jgi:hypothetical protein
MLSGTPVHGTRIGLGVQDVKRGLTQPQTGRFALRFVGSVMIPSLLLPSNLPAVA